jgi:DNA-directed RNA polymerase subunit RPC12/RpoP
MSSEKSPDNYILVVCPTCHTRLHPRWDQAGMEIVCPDCGEKTMIPWPEARKAKPKSKETGQYHVQDAGKPSAFPQRSADDYILVVCPTCHTRLYPRWDQAGRKIVCPDCGVKMKIPWPKARKPEPKPKPDEIGQYGVNEAVKPLYVQTQYLDSQAQIFAEPVPPPPPWTFFSGIFDFPWYRDTISRWAYLSFGLVVLGEFIAVGLILSGVGSGDLNQFSIMGLGFFALPIIWVSLWTFAYAAACCLSVVQDTAAGSDKVTAWPEPNWREWFWKLLYAGTMFVLTGLASGGVALLVELQTGQLGVPLFIAAFFLFPVFLLSSLEADSFWMPASWVVLRSLVFLGWCWIIFYLEAGLLAAGWLGLVLLAVPAHPYVTVLGAGPILSAIVLIYARLLGRLGWKITDVA